MDPTHHHPLAEEQQGYGFYTEQDPNYAHGLSYASYQVVPQHAAPSQTHVQQQAMQFHPMNIIPQHQYPHNVYPPSPPHGSGLPLPPPSPTAPDLYDPLSPPVSGSDTSADGLYHHNSSGTNSPTSSRRDSLVHRTAHRYNPTPSPTSSSGRRSRSHSQGSEDDDMIHPGLTESIVHSRKEATRRQRIEAEQRRRDELRDGYAKLKDVLPLSTQKSSKVSLLDRATNHIITLEKTNQEMQERLQTLEQDLARLRALNEKISLNAGETPSPGMFDGRPISPPPDIPASVQTISTPKIPGPPSDDSSLSEGDF